MSFSLSSLKAFRPVNLLIITLLEFLLHQHLLLNALKAEQISPELDNLLLTLLIGFTILLTSSGYLINDILDHSIDKINKLGQNQTDILGGQRKAFLLYLIQTLSCLILGAYLAHKLSKWEYFWMTPLMILFLWLYSSKMKNHVFLGNLGVSIFAVMVILIVWLAECEAIGQLTSGSFQHIRDTFLCYAIFAFFTTWARELIKDAEDIEGDRLAGLKTFPIQYGFGSTNKFIVLLCLILMLLIAGVTFTTYAAFTNFQIIFGCFAIFLPIIAITGIAFNASTKMHYSRMSILMKMVMLSGVIFLLTIN